MRINLESSFTSSQVNESGSEADLSREEKVNNFVALFANAEEDDVFDLECNFSIPLRNLPKVECSMQSLACSIGCNCSTSVCCTK